MSNFVDSVKTSLWYLFNTDLAAVILMGILKFAAIGIFWAGLFELVFPSKQGDLVFASSLSAIDIVIGFVYFIWLRRQMDGYTSSIRRYKRIITLLDIATDKVAGMYDSLDTEQRVKAHAHIIKIKTAMQFLIFYTYKIFAPANQDVLVSTPQIGHDSNIFDVVIESDLGDVEDGLKNLGCKICIRDIPHELLKIQNGITDPIEMSHAIRSFMYRSISSMIGLGLFVDGHISLLHPELSEIADELLNIDTEHSIVEPTIFDKHAGFTLIAYFGSWLPISLWVRFAFLTAVLIYPFVMFVLVGPYIYRQWLGNPFSPTRPVVLVSHKQWRNDHIKKIEAKFRTTTPVIELDNL